MSRGQQGQVFNQTSGESTQAFGNAENAYNLAQGDVGNYQAQLSKYAAENPYQAGGEFQNAQNEVLANTSDASAAAASNRLQTQAQRTGQNPAGATAATESMEQAGARNLSAEQSAANAERIGSEAGYNKGVLQGYGEVPGMEEGIAKGYSGLYGNALDTEENAAKTPSFLETLEGQLAAGGDAAITAFCPATGTLYLMADGSERPVEALNVGDKIMGIDDEPQTIEEIQSGRASILVTYADDGSFVLTSPTHAFALPRGGFVVAARSAGKIILGKSGPTKVESTYLLKDKQFVFNIITDGSHTYRAGGLWSLGVGDAERQVGMNEWALAGEKLLLAVAG